MVTGGFLVWAKLRDDDSNIVNPASCAAPAPTLMVNHQSWSMAPALMLFCVQANCANRHLESVSVTWTIMTQSSELDPLSKKNASYLVQRILKQQSIDRPVAATDDLREIGLSSLDMVELVLSVESEFNVRIPETAITPANFRSIASIDALIGSLRT